MHAKVACKTSPIESSSCGRNLDGFDEEREDNGHPLGRVRLRTSCSLLTCRWSLQQPSLPNPPSGVADVEEILRTGSRVCSVSAIFARTCSRTAHVCEGHLCRQVQSEPQSIRPMRMTHSSRPLQWPVTVLSELCSTIRLKKDAAVTVTVTVTVMLTMTFTVTFRYSHDAQFFHPTHSHHLNIFTIQEQPFSMRGDSSDSSTAVFN